MKARAIWIIALVGVAILTALVQLDRQTIRSPQLAQLVPESFRSAAQLRIAAKAVANDDPSIALKESIKLVERRPLPSEHLRLLAQAQIASGQFDAGINTIQLAAHRGWRDPIAQESMFRLALDAGDHPEAARRYLALLLRKDTDFALLEELGESFLGEADGSGRVELAKLVHGGDRWLDYFVGRGAQVVPPEAFLEIIERALELGTRFDCQNLKIAHGLLTSRDPEAGRKLLKSIDARC